MKTILLSVGLGALALATTLTLGCGSSSTSRPQSESTQSSAEFVVPASPETRGALGVTIWKLSKVGNLDTCLLTGYDDDSNVRAEITLWKKRDADGYLVEGGVDFKTASGVAHYHYAKADGQWVSDDDFAASPELTRALPLVQADLARASASIHARGPGAVVPLDHLALPTDVPLVTNNPACTTVLAPLNGKTCNETILEDYHEQMDSMKEDPPFAKYCNTWQYSCWNTGGKASRRVCSTPWLPNCSETMRNREWAIQNNCGNCLPEDHLKETVPPL
jgi:hypothetical protein